MATSESDAGSALQKELVDIKRLLVLQLRKQGATQEDIAAALGVSQSSVSRMFPGGGGSAKAPKVVSKRPKR